MRTISKDALVHSPILVFQDFENPFTLYERGSGYASGFNLTHVKDNKKRSILYGGPNFTNLEKKIVHNRKRGIKCCCCYRKTNTISPWRRF